MAETFGKQQKEAFYLQIFTNLNQRSMIKMFKMTKFRFLLTINCKLISLTVKIGLRI